MKAILHLIYEEHQKTEGGGVFVAHMWGDITIPTLPQNGSQIQICFSEHSDDSFADFITVDYYFDPDNKSLVPIVRFKSVEYGVGSDEESPPDNWREDREELFDKETRPFLEGVFGLKRVQNWVYQKR